MAGRVRVRISSRNWISVSVASGDESGGGF